MGEEELSPGKRCGSWWQEGKSWEQGQPSSPGTTSTWRGTAGAAKNNRWDEKAGRQEIWQPPEQETPAVVHQCDSPLCDGEPKEYQLWYQEGSDVTGECVPCVLEDHPSQQRTIKNLILQVDQTRPGVLNKMQMKVTKKNSSTSGAKVTKQEFSKWMMSRRR